MSLTEMLIGHTTFNAYGIFSQVLFSSYPDESDNMILSQAPETC